MRAALLAAASLWPMIAVAADTAADAAAQEPIIVTGRAEGYRVDQSLSATRTETPLLDIPQSLNVVTRERIEDQAFRSLGEVLRYTPGVTVAQGEGNRDQIAIRGQNTTADFFTDGVRDDVQYFRPLYNLERVEVLKGPNALAFGRGGGGGVVNRVQKTPLDGLAVAGEAIADTFGDTLGAADVNLPLGGGAALRVNAFYERLDNHRDLFGGDRWGVNPYLAFQLGEGWTLGLTYEHLRDVRVTDRGVPSLAGTFRPLRGYRDLVIGVPGINQTGLNADIVRARLDGRLAEGVRWSSVVYYGDFDKYYDNVFPNAPATSPTGTVLLDAYKDPTQRANFFAQTNLAWDVATGPLDHTLLFGLEYGVQRTRNERRVPVFSSRVFSLANPVYPAVTFPTITRRNRSEVDLTSAYGQDQVAIGRFVDLVLGVRFDRFELRGLDLVQGRPFGRTDEVVSPRVGVVLKPRENLSVYGSYVQSFLPRSGDQFTTLSTAQENLAPERFTNYEAGVKWDAGALSLTAALFRLDRTNATTPDPQNPQRTINVGATRTQGVELSANGRIAKAWSIAAGYSYLDARLGGNDLVRLAQTPEHQLSTWTRYDVHPRLGIGLGVLHQSSQFATIRTVAATPRGTNATRLPAFTRVDLGLFAKLTERIEAQVNIENLLDATYFPDAHNDNNITTGAPLNARFSLRAKL